MVLEVEYSIDFINPDDTSKWTTLKDIVDYIEAQLENKQGDENE